MITHAYYGREGIIVTDDGTKYPFTAKWHWLPKGYAVPQGGELLFPKQTQPARFTADLNGEPVPVIISPPWVNAQTAPVIIALLRQAVKRFEIDKEPVVSWPVRLKVPSVEEALIQLRRGDFGFTPIPIN